MGSGAVTDIDPQKALHTLAKDGPRYAEAKGQRVAIEEGLRTIKALEMAKSQGATVAAREMEAYASEAYRTAVAGLGAAVEREETLRWRLIAAQCAIETWRSLEASNRRMDKGAA